MLYKDILLMSLLQLKLWLIEIKRNSKDYMIILELVVQALRNNVQLGMILMARYYMELTRIMNLPY